MFLFATVAAASYFVSMALAPIFPGTAWTDPEFEAETSKPAGLAPQQLVTYAVCVIVLIAIALAV